MKTKTTTRRLVVASAVILGSLGVSASATAYSGDNSNPTSCSSPTSLVNDSILRSGVVVGRVQLRFSDPCNTSWSRTCAASGYTILNTSGIGDTGGERFSYPSAVGYFYTEQRQGTGSSNCGIGTLTGGSDYSKAWFNDCAEAGLGSCKSRAFGVVAQGGWEGPGEASE